MVITLCVSHLFNFQLMRPRRWYIWRHTCHYDKYIYLHLSIAIYNFIILIVFVNFFKNKFNYRQFVLYMKSSFKPFRWAKDICIWSGFYHVSNWLKITSTSMFCIVCTLISTIFISFYQKIILLLLLDNHTSLM